MYRITTLNVLPFILSLLLYNALEAQVYALPKGRFFTKMLNNSAIKASVTDKKRRVA